MSAEIARAQTGIVGDINRLAAGIDQATIQEAKTALDKMAMAREWAKLQENAAEVTERLAWLEMVLLRRVGQLDPTILPSAKRAAARHFATLDEGELSRLFHDYPARTAVTVYNLWSRAQGIRKSTRRGRDYLTQARVLSNSEVDDDEEEETTLRHAVAQRLTTVRQAAAVIIDEYAGHRQRISVSEVVNAFIDDEMPHLNAIGSEVSAVEAAAFRSGLSAAVREAFISAPAEATERSWEIPAFITTHDRETDEWLRIPSEFARVKDARNMLQLRRAQIASAQRRLNALESVLNHRFGVGDERVDGDEWLRNDPTAVSRRLEAEHRASLSMEESA